MNESTSPSLTPQQQRLRSEANGLGKYKLLVSAESNSMEFIGFELYELFLSNLSGILGFGLRSICLPLFLKSCGKSLALARSVRIRQPKRISLGSSIIIDENVVLDVRLGESPDQGAIEVSDNCFIGRDTILAAKKGRIALGEACNVSSNCRIATESSIEIGKSVLIAAYTYIGPGNHQLDESGKPLVDQEMVNKGGVRIGNNVWIGTRVTILDGVTIGENAVIGAHSLVKDDVPAGARVAGVPAKVLA